MDVTSLSLPSSAFLLGLKPPKNNGRCLIKTKVKTKIYTFRIGVLDRPDRERHVTHAPDMLRSSSSTRSCVTFRPYRTCA